MASSNASKARSAKSKPAKAKAGDAEPAEAEAAHAQPAKSKSSAEPKPASAKRQSAPKQRGAKKPPRTKASNASATNLRADRRDIQSRNPQSRDTQSRDTQSRDRDNNDVGASDANDVDTGDTTEANDVDTGNTDLNDTPVDETSADGPQDEGTSQADDKSKRRNMKSGVIDTSASLLPVLTTADDVAAHGDLEPLAESVRYILARPQIAVDSELPPVVAVVSPLSGEGVTTVSSVFSSVLSNDSGVETCRVDLSWSSTSKPGFFEVVMGAAELDDVLDWNGRSATLHTGGVTPVERHRLARSEELDKLIAELSSRFQHVILDLPSILGGSDGLAMMRLADAYLLVVKHGVTTLHQVQAAVDHLGDFESLGTVLNQVRTRTPRTLSRWLSG